VEFLEKVHAKCVDFFQKVHANRKVHAKCVDFEKCVY